MKRKAWEAWQVSQAYNRLPSEIYGVEGAAGYFFDQGIFIFGRWVESECQEAESSASNQAFANMNRARTFARCMGDDMSKSTAGFADPFAGVVPNQKSGNGSDDGDQIIAEGF